MSRVEFSLPVRLPTYNASLRKHWGARRRFTDSLGWLLLAAWPKSSRPAEPMQYVDVVVRRHSTREPDPDGFDSCAKPLMDVLQPPSKRHPYGQGVIINDDPRHARVRVEHVHSKLQQTDVIITQVNEPFR